MNLGTKLVAMGTTHIRLAQGSQELYSLVGNRSQAYKDNIKLKMIKNTREFRGKGRASSEGKLAFSWRNQENFRHKKCHTDEIYVFR